MACGYCSCFLLSSLSCYMNVSPVCRVLRQSYFKIICTHVFFYALFFTFPQSHLHIPEAVRKEKKKKEGAYWTTKRENLRYSEGTLLHLSHLFCHVCGSYCHSSCVFSSCGFPPFHELSHFIFPSEVLPVVNRSETALNVLCQEIREQKKVNKRKADTEYVQKSCKEQCRAQMRSTSVQVKHPSIRKPIQTPTRCRSC